MASVKSMLRGHLYLANCVAQWASSSAASSSDATEPGAGSTTAMTCSPQSSSGIPKTAASPTAGWDSRAASTSAGYTLTPPEMIMSIFRSRRYKKPSSSSSPMSPTVKKSPCRLAAVFSSSPLYRKSPPMSFM